MARYNPKLTPNILSLPAFRKAQAQLENEVGKAQTNAGKRMLKLYRSMLRHHNTRNHIITIEGGMGLYYVCIARKHGSYPGDDAKVTPGRAVPFDCGGYGNSPIMKLLHAINDSMLSDWDYTLEGDRLN